MSAVDSEITTLVITGTAIFLAAPAFIVLYILTYNRRKKRHADEKIQMELSFTNELVKTRHEVQEQTMQTIGADLHDNIGQLLSLTSLTLKSAECGDPEAMNKKLKAAVELNSQAIQEMRLLGKLLQGEQLMARGLAEAIRHQANWLQKNGQYQVTCNAPEMDSKGANPEKDLICFRIVQEVLNNIIKHARASAIEIRLNYDDEKLQLCISDNGIGFNAADIQQHQLGMGLGNIRRRAAMVGGAAHISSALNQGARFDVFIPYP